MGSGVVAGTAVWTDGWEDSASPPAALLETPGALELPELPPPQAARETIKDNAKKSAKNRVAFMIRPSLLFFQDRPSVPVTRYSQRFSRWGVVLPFPSPRRLSR